MRKPSNDTTENPVNVILIGLVTLFLGVAAFVLGYLVYEAGGARDYNWAFLCGVAGFNGGILIGLLGLVLLMIGILLYLRKEKREQS